MLGTTEVKARCGLTPEETRWSLTHVCYKANIVDLEASPMRKIQKIVLVLFTMSLAVFAQGNIYKINLSAPGLAIEIVDAKALTDFRFGPGPGNFLNGAPYWKSKSWIVDDWDHPVAEPDKSLRRVQATFSLDRGRGPRLYVVFYVFDPVAKQGFVYLPGRGEPLYSQNTNLLYRGDDYEGHWFRATSEWTSHVQTLIEGSGK